MPLGPEHGKELNELLERSKVVGQHIRAAMEKETARGSTDWFSYPNTLLCLLSEVMNTFKELCLACNEDNASRSAWATRNLLELWIWCSYCAPSEQNTRELVQDVFRDSSGMINAGLELVSMSPDFAAFAPEINKTRSRLEDLAKEAGLSKADHKYKKVSEVATELGPDVANAFKYFNIILSKLVHPTSIVIMNLYSTSFMNSFVNVSYGLGAMLARTSIDAIGKANL